MFLERQRTSSHSNFRSIKLEESLNKTIQNAGLIRRVRLGVPVTNVDLLLHVIKKNFLKILVPIHDHFASG